MQRHADRDHCSIVRPTAAASAAGGIGRIGTHELRAKHRNIAIETVSNRLFEWNIRKISH